MDPNTSFDNIIEFDPGSSSEKENENHRYKSKAPKTTVEQFKRISDFMSVHKQELLDKTTFDCLWSDLAAKLNDIGPPEHTIAEWKRIWSVHKYNCKRKRISQSENIELSDHSDDDTSTPGLVLPKRSKSFAVSTELSTKDLPKECDEIEETTASTQSLEFEKKLDKMISLQSELCKKMDTVIEQQSAIISNQDSVIRELQRSNSFLKDIAQK